MSDAILSLKEGFQTVIEQKTKAYLYKEPQSKQWMIHDKKILRLNEVFTSATCTLLEEQTTETPSSSPANPIPPIQALSERLEVYQCLLSQGESLYERYSNPSHVFKRTLLKILRFCMPYLFAYSIKTIEQKTINSYETYSKTATEKIAEICSRLSLLKKKLELEALSKKIPVLKSLAAQIALRSYLTLLDEIRRDPFCEKDFMPPPMPAFSVEAGCLKSTEVAALLSLGVNFTSLDLSQTVVSSQELDHWKQKGWLNQVEKLTLSPNPHLSKELVAAHEAGERQRFGSNKT